MGGHLECMGKRRGVYRVLVGILKGRRDHWQEDPDRDERLKLKLILRKCFGRVWTGLICLSIMTSGRLL